MATTFTAFKPLIDLPEWRPLAPNLNSSGAGTTLICDLRNTEDRHPEIFSLSTAAVFNAYHVKNDGWSFLGSPALTGAFGAGASGIYAPSHGARGTIAAGATSTSFTPSATIGATIGANQLADRGDKRGFKVRIIDNGAGGSGKIEERLIVANAGNTTTPLITLDSALSFTPVSGSAFEILSGRAYLLSASTLAAGMWKYWDPALNVFSGNLSTTNLPATVSTDSSLVALDELHVPHTNWPGEGFLTGSSTYNTGYKIGQVSTGVDKTSLSCLLATGSSTTTITGQATGGDVSVLANEYRNFQIRIVEDTLTPTAVGQRRKISSHTAGPSAVYTVPTWTVTPSTSAKFVIENPNEILLWSSGQTNTYTYAAFAIAGGQAADSWSTATYAARPAAMLAGGISFQAFGMLLDAQKNCRYSQIYSFRGGNLVSLDIFDIAGAATGSWSATYPYASIGTGFTTGTTITYDPVGFAPTVTEINDSRGCMAYINLNGTQNFYRFNACSRSMNQWAQIRYPQGTATVGGRLAVSVYQDADGGARISKIFAQRSSSFEIFDILTQR